MKTTLKDVLLTQDMGEQGADKICDAVLNDNLSAEKDPISFIICRAFIDGNYSDYQAMATDLAYAINQLKKAKDKIEENL